MRTRVTVRGAVSLMVVAAGLAALSVPATPALAEEDEAAAQIPLIVAADQISAAAKGQETRADNGFAGFWVEALAHELRVYWKGTPTPEPAQVIEEQRKQGINVVVLPARYSERELVAAEAELIGQRGVSAVGPLYDGSGLLVSVPGDERSAWELPAIRAVAQKVPVKIAPYEHPLVAAGRQHDTSAYKGGAFYHWPIPEKPGYIGLCTTGFAVKVGVKTKMLSAGHCRADGDTVLAGNGGAPEPVMGTISGDDNPHDTLLIETASAGSVYYGPHTSVSSKPIHMVLGQYTNTLACTSGAMTGQHCKIRIMAVNQNINLDDGEGTIYPVSQLVKAEQDDKTVAVGQGDSGGPVVAQDSIPAGFFLVYPLGTITALDQNHPVACGASQYTTLCSWRMWYADVNLSLTRYGATIVK